MVNGKRLGLVGKVLLGAGAVASLFFGNVKANTLSLALNCNVPGVQNSSAELTHSNAPYSLDSEFIPQGDSEVEIYYLEDTLPMEGIGKPADSMETETAYIRGRGLNANGVNAKLGVNMSPACYYSDELFTYVYEENMTYKNIFEDLYNVNDNNSLVGTYDVKKCSDDANTIPLTIQNGLSYLMNVRFEKQDKFGLNDLQRFSDYWLQKCNFNNGNCERFGQDGEYLNFVDFADFADKWDSNAN